MSHEMRPPEKTKFAGPAWTVLMKKDENKEGGVAVQGMLDAINAAPAGAVYVMSVENGTDYAGIGGLMATGMKPEVWPQRSSMPVSATRHTSRRCNSLSSAAAWSPPPW